MLLKLTKIESYRKLFVIAADIIIICASFYAAFFLRFDGHILREDAAVCFKTMPMLVALRLLFFYRFGLYYGNWHSASVNDVFNAFKAMASSSVAFIILLVFIFGSRGFPRSVFVVDAMLTTFLILGSRFPIKFHFIFSRRSFSSHGTNKRILIVGAGDAGYSIVEEVRNNRSLRYNVVGFIDDDPNKRNMRIHGVQVLGTWKDISRIVTGYKVDEIIVAIPSAGRLALAPIINECHKTKAKISILPSMGDLINGKVSVNQIREVQIEDLLGREVVDIDTALIEKYIQGKRVLVTGAGGSIGSEICRQVMRFNPAMLVMLGRGENSIYLINNELSASAGNTQLKLVLGDIINRKKLEGVFMQFAPQIVFHAGADKHVPLLELNPDEAVFNNIIGTKNVIEVAEQYKAEKVVCISSDKAADPVSVMGCAKRVAELVIQSRKNKPGATVVMGVRFGNVLGSRGSVIPLFKQQLKAGGPLTITHPDMLRYFMTIPEASRLVLQAGTNGSSGGIFLLDMGNPVKIIDLAKQMIKLSGFEPDKDIAIKFTGIRPGEKLVESLTGKNEKLIKTSHPKVFELNVEGEQLTFTENDIEELKQLAIKMDNKGIKKKLKEVVPNYNYMM